MQTIVELFSKHRLISALIILNLIGGLFYGGRYFTHRNAEQSAQQKTEENTAEMVEKHGVMPREQYLNICRIGQSCQDSGGKIADTDLVYMIAILERKYGSTKEMIQRSSEKVDASSRLQLLFTHPTPAQQQMVFDEFLRDTQNPTEGYAASASLITSSSLLARFNDRRIVPYLLKLIEHPNKSVQRIAKDTLQSIGYSTAVASSTGNTHR